MFHCYVSLPKCISPTRNNPPKKKIDRILDPSHSSIRASISTNPHQFANKTFKKLYYIIISKKKNATPLFLRRTMKNYEVTKKISTKNKENSQCSSPIHNPSSRQLHFPTVAPQDLGKAFLHTTKFQLILREASS